MSTKRKYDNRTNESEINNHEQITVKKSKKKKNVRFDDVTVYYFARSQGFVSVPSQGTVTLGLYFNKILLFISRNSLRYGS
jgi:hypothetical protein